MKRLITLLTVLLSLVIFVMPTHADDIFQCYPDSGAYFVGKRLHVHCTVADNGISYFALPATTTNKKGKVLYNPEADRVLSIITTAVAEGKDIIIHYDSSDVSGEAIGCQTYDCRLIKAIAIMN